MDKINICYLLLQILNNILYINIQLTNTSKDSVCILLHVCKLPLQE